MKLLYCLVLSLSACNPGLGQKFNLGFEQKLKGQVLPMGWFKWGGPNSCIYSSDSITKHSGRYSVSISNYNEQKLAKDFGGICYILPGGYDGDSVTFEGFIKAEKVKNGHAGLVLRIDGDAGHLAIDDTSREFVTNSTDWTKYSITLPLVQGAKQIFLAGVLTGTGTAWFDSFRVWIDNNEIQTIREPVQGSPKAERDHEFDHGSKIQINKLTELQKQSLFRLCKIWGFLKYYHPDIVAGDVNWDYELFRIMIPILNATNAKQVNSILSDWLEKRPLRKDNNVNHNASTNTRTIKLRPDLTWINDCKTLSKKICGYLENARTSQRPNSQYYVALKSPVGNPVFENESYYRDVDFPDAGFQLLSLFRYWNIIQYFFPYRHLIDQNWDSVLTKYIPKFASANTDLTYILTVLELIGETKDSHARIRSNVEELAGFYGGNIIPLKLRFIEDKLVVVGHIDQKYSLKYPVIVGDVITKINGVSIQNIVKEKIKYFPGSNYRTQLRDLSREILRTNDSALIIEYQNDMGLHEIKARTYPLNQVAFQDSIQPPAWRRIDNSIGYIFPQKIERQQVKNIINELTDTKGIIIDFRCYPSEMLLFEFCNYLMPAPTEFVKFSIGSLLTPGEFYFKQPLKAGRHNPEFYKGKVIILIDEWTQSSAEYHAQALKMIPDATLLGSPTAGADGNVSQIPMPGGLRVTMTGIGVYYPDGGETQRIGIVPDVIVKPTIKGIRQDIDEPLEAAIDMINKETNQK